MIRSSHLDTVPRLSRFAAEKVALRCAGRYDDVLATLPGHLKDLMRAILLKRGKITEAAFLALVHPEVRELDLSECSMVTSIQLTAVPKCLFKLDLNGTECAFSPRDLSFALSGQRHLRVLFLKGSPADMGVAETIAESCPNIRELDLGRCPDIGDKSIRLLGGALSKLKSLNLCYTSITDGGMEAFSLAAAPHDALKEIRIDGCTKVSDLGVEALLRSCRRINILIFHNCPGVTERSRLALEEYGKPVKQLMWTVY